jgi:hypothetical protein
VCDVHLCYLFGNLHLNNLLPCRCGGELVFYCKLSNEEFIKEKQSTDGTLVQLPNGLIKGRISLTTTKRPYWAFQKVPFASPPVGSLRFRPPVPPKNWYGVLETTKNDITCYQVPSDSPLESEDCLYLNVYTPRASDT